MANYQITVTALDKATPVLKDVGKQFGNLNKPIASVGGALESAIKKSGFGKFGKDIAAIGKSVGEVGTAIERFARPFAAIAGVGGLAGLGTVAGIAKLADEWSRFGGSLGRVADMSGVGTTRLQLLQGAARRAGSSSEAMSGSLNSLGNLMQDAFYGRAPVVVSLFDQLGLSMRRTASGAMDSADMLMQLSDKAKNQQNPQAVQKLLQMAGIDPSLFDLIKRGPAGIRSLMAETAGTGVVMTPEQIAAAKHLEESFVGLKDAASGLSNEIAWNLTPTIGPLVTKLTEILSLNRKPIADVVSNAVSGGLRQIGTIRTLLGGVGDVASGNVGRGLSTIGSAEWDFFTAPMVGAWNLGKRAFGGSPSGGGNQFGVPIPLPTSPAISGMFPAGFDYAGYRRYVEARESGGDPNARSRAPGSTAFGLWQINDPTMAGLNRNYPEAHFTGKNDERAFQALTAENLAGLTASGDRHASSFADLYAAHHYGLSTAVDMLRSGPRVGSGYAAEGGKVDVAVTFKNAPPGTIASTTTRGNATSSTRIEHMMLPMGTP